MAITIYSDGACSGNPGIGGWGAVIEGPKGRKEIFRGEAMTTNNKMELTAVIRAREACPEGAKAAIITDSQYVKLGITEWIGNWKRRGWKTVQKKPVLNRDLWQVLDSLAAARDLEWKWVKGHAGHPGNERADELARRGIEEIRARQ